WDVARQCSGPIWGGLSAPRFSSSMVDQTGRRRKTVTRFRPFRALQSLGEHVPQGNIRCAHLPWAIAGCCVAASKTARGLGPSVVAVPCRTLARSASEGERRGAREIDGNSPSLALRAGICPYPLPGIGSPIFLSSICMSSQTNFFALGLRKRYEG